MDAGKLPSIMERESSSKSAESLTPPNRPSWRSLLRFQKHEAEFDAGPEPDGGWAAITQAMLTHLVCFNTWGFIISFGAFQTYYHTSLPVSSSQISWIGSIQVFLIYFVGAFSGRVTDAGYFHLVYGIGVVLTVLGIFMASLATEYWQLVLSQALCVGLGSGLQFCPAMALNATYWKKYRVFAVAFAMAGAGTGGLVYPAVVRELLSRPGIGFPWTLRILGFIMLATSTVCFVMFRTRLPPRSGGQFVEFAALKEPTYLFFVIGMFFNFWALYFEFYYVGQYARTELGFSYATSIDLLLLTNGIGVVGRLGSAYLANTYTGPLNFVIPFAMITGISYYTWTAVSTASGMWAFAAVYGLASNVVQGLWPSTLGSLTEDPSKTGARMGLGFTIVSFGLLTGPPMGGALASSHGYLAAQVWGGTCLVMAGSLMLCARFAKTGAVMIYKV